MQPILRIDGPGATLRLGVQRNGTVARLTAATLQIWRAGTLPSPSTTLLLDAQSIDATWHAVFVLPEEWLAVNPPGRYTATLTTTCGITHYEVHKGRRPRLAAHTTVAGDCGDSGAVCVAECPGGSLSFTVLSTELFEPLLTEDGFVLVR